MAKRVGVLLLTVCLGLSPGLAAAAEDTGEANEADDTQVAQKIEIQSSETAPAQEEQPSPPQRPQTRSSAARVTQAELAHILVHLLGLARFLPPNASSQEIFAVLMQNQIAPPDGWDAEAVVTKGDLAVVVVKCLRAMGEILDFDPDDIKAAIAYLQQQGISIETIGASVDVVGPLGNPVARNVFDPTTDPLERQRRFGEPDEQESGADAEFVPNRTAVARQEVIQVITVIPQPKPSKPSVTKFKPAGGFAL